MAKIKLTDTKLKTLKATGQRYAIMDSVIGGFGVRVSDRGTRTFVLRTRFPGQENAAWRALGEYPAMSLEEARERAGEWRKLVKRGVDPAVAEERERQAELRKRAHTFASVAEAWFADKLANERKGAEVKRDVRRDLFPVWADRPITEITPLDVRTVIRAIKERGAPYMAHSMLGHAKRLFSWAIDQEVYGLESSPCDRIKPKALIGAKKPRQRILDADELKAFWRATSRMPYPYGPTLRMLLLTGGRHREVADARWSEIDVAEKLWAIGAERFKSDAEHMVPLSDDVCALLAKLLRFKKGDHLFSTSFGAKPTVISDKVKAKLDARMLRTIKGMARIRGEDPNGVELKPWVIHDLRRTLRTHLSALRIPDHIAEMVIGHGRQGLQRVYDQHRYLNEMREALTLWAARLRSIVEPPPANVVAIKKARAR